MQQIANQYLVPNSDTCVVVGDLVSWPREVVLYKAILWLRATDGRRLPPPGAAKLNTVFLDRSPRSQIVPTLENFIRLNARHMPSVFISTEASGPHAAAYEVPLSEIVGTLTSTHRARVTREKDGFRWQQNLLLNLPNYLSRRLPSRWAGVARGLPAFICGAGPSLDVSAPYLAKYVEQGIVLAADSSLRLLSKYGVCADFVVSVDVAKVPEKCLVATAIPTRAVLSAVSPPSWSGAMPPDACYFVFSNQITLDWIAKLGGEKTVVNGMENCGATALELARYLGCSPIYLFGMDLSLSEQNAGARHHSGADVSIYTQSGFDSGVVFPRIPGNFSDTVPTHAIDDWRTLDKRLADWPEQFVYNVNDRGARLKNAAPILPSAFSVPIPAQNRGKAECLRSLAAPDPLKAEESACIFQKLLAVESVLKSALPALSEANISGETPRIVALWQSLLRDPDVAYCLGAFSFKMLPHLLPPVVEGIDEWRCWFQEMEALTDGLHSILQLWGRPPCSTR